MKKLGLPIFDHTTKPLELVALVAAFLLAMGGGALIGFNTTAAVWLIGLFGILAYALLAMWRPSEAFLFLVFAAATESLSNIRIYSGISLMVGLGGIFLGVWIARLALRKTTIVKSKDYGILLGLALWVILSMLATDEAARFRSLLTYFLQFLLVILVVNFTTSAKKLRALGNVLIASACFSAVFILMDQAGWLPATITRTLTSYFVLGQGDTYTRSAGFFSDPNYTAAFLVAVLPFILERGLRARSWDKRMFFLLLIGLVLAAYSTTVSLGGLVGLIVVAALQFVRLNRRNGLVIAVILLLIVVGASKIQTQALTSENDFARRVSLTLDSARDVLEASDSEAFEQFGSNRGAIWMASWQALRRSPIWGYGPGGGIYATAVYIGHANTDGVWSHNMFLTFALDLGIIGLILLLVLMFDAVRAVRPMARERAPDPALISERKAIFTAIIACLVMGLGLDILVLKLLWLLIGMALAYKNITQTTSSYRESPALLR